MLLNRINKKKRIFVIYLIILIAFFILAIRLSYVKIIKGEEYLIKAQELWTRCAPVIGARGNIYDRNGKQIVGNSLAPTIVVIPRQIKDKILASKSIASILNTNKDEILAHLEKNVSVEYLNPYGKNITIEQATKIKELGLSGVYVVGDSIRSYPYESLMAPLLGIVGIDNQGITGLEYIYDDYLKGDKGGVKIYTDAHGMNIENLTTYYDKSTIGADIYLTIDLNVQLVLERMIRNIVSMYSPDEVIMIALNPKTSEVYGMGSYPTFDIRNYKEYDTALLNRNLPIFKNYEPGSVGKIITFAAGLEEQVFRLEDRFNDPGYMIIDGVRIKDWKAGGHGTETYLEVLQNSCNPGFMTIGLRLGKDRLFKYIEGFGLGQKTGIDLLGESTGILFDKDLIGNVELATASFGQGNAVTAIQLCNAAAAAVNGGKLHKPYVLKKIVKDDKVLKENEPTEIRRVISEETSRKMRYALECVCSLGTARHGYVEGYRVGGKTGTAQIAENGHYVSGKYILSFMGIAPMNDPEVLVYLAINNPKNTIQYGGVVCAPLVKSVLEEIFPLLGIEKQEGGISKEIRFYIDKNIYTVENYIGKKLKDIRPTINYNFIIEGSGDTIIAQVPSPNEKLIEGGSVILYTK